MPSHGNFRLVDCRVESWPLAQEFRISRGAKSAATVVVAEVSGGGMVGRGECTPYARYGESVDGVINVISSYSGPLTRQALLQQMSSGAARNALDCALWDLEAKLAGKRAWELTGAAPPHPTRTFYTLSLDTPERMATAARELANLRDFKLKLGAPGDDARMRAVRSARPDARLITDANEGWAADQLDDLLAVAAECQVDLIEQPLPVGDDQVLQDLNSPVPLCADESASPGRPVAELADRYDAVNIKLDKAGGLTGALQLLQEAEDAGLKVFIGSMVATSLGIAPALLLADRAQWVDLDSPLLLAKDRPDGMSVVDGVVMPPAATLWG